MSDLKYVLELKDDNHLMGGLYVFPVTEFDLEVDEGNLGFYPVSGKGASHYFYTEEWQTLRVTKEAIVDLG